MARACIGLGSNLGDRRANLERALALLAATEGVTVRAASAFIETDPVGGPPQGKFLNAAAELQTTLEPRALLEALLEVERRMGRVRRRRWGPRLIDLDLLLYDDRIIDQEDLVVPHPRMHERAFVLAPLAEIAGQVIHPLTGRTIEDLLRDVQADDTQISPRRHGGHGVGRLKSEGITEKIIGAAIEVHRFLGPGLLESAYEVALCRELALLEIPFERQKELPVNYRGVRLDAGYRLDLVVAGSVIVEVKAVDRLLPVHEAQLLTYLRLSGLEVGLLLNFNVPVLKEGMKRLVL